MREQCVNIWAFDEWLEKWRLGKYDRERLRRHLQSLSDSNYNSHLIANIKEEPPVLGNPWTDTSKESLCSSSGSEKTSRESFESDLLGGAFCGSPSRVEAPGSIRATVLSP